MFAVGPRIRNFPGLFLGTPVEFLKIFGFKFLSFNRTIDLHCHLEIFL